MENNQSLKDIANFINKNFVDDEDFFTNLSNFMKLIDYINENNITDISVFDVNYLLENCKLLSDTIFIISSDEKINLELKNHNNLIIRKLYSYITNLIFDNIEDMDEKTNEMLSDDILDDYLNLISKIPKLNEEERTVLQLKILNGDDQARRRFIEDNLRLVIKIAKKYKKYNIPIMDLVQDGNIGLIKAVKYFNPKLGYKFSTYAGLCIEREIVKNLKSYKTIKIPLNLYNYLNKMHMIMAKYFQENGVEIDNELLAEEMNLSVNDVIELKKIPYFVDSLNSHPIDNIFHSNDTCNLDSNDSIVEIIEDNNDYISNVTNKIFLEEFMKEFNKVNLNSRHKEMLLSRMGYYDNIKKTFSEIAKDYHISKQRVNEIEQKTILKLRSDKRIKQFQTDME